MGPKFSGRTPQDLILLGFIKVQMTSKMHVHIVLAKSTTVTFSNACTPLLSVLLKHMLLPGL